MFNISKLVNKITERGAGSGSGGQGGGGSDPSRSTSSHVVQNTEEQHSEGFLCPQCMRAFPSSEVLETHYNDVHVENEKVSISGSEDTSQDNGTDEIVEILREQVQTLQLCLAEEKITSEDLKNEVLRLQNSYQMAGDSQGKQFDADRALLNSEVALLRKQLTDSLEQISALKKDKKKIILKNEALQSETEALKSTIGSLETQLTHKNSIDDAAVLKQELVSVQRMMDNLSLEKEKQIEELNAKIQTLEKSDKSRELRLQLDKAEENVSSLTSTVENQRIEMEKLVSDHQMELKTSSSKLAEANSQLSDLDHRKADLENQCTTLTEELKRLNDQHAELYRKFEGGEGASAALAALQQENEQLKENSTSLNQKISELSATLQQLSKTTETEKLNLTSTIDGLNTELSAMKENCKASNTKNLELTSKVSELNEQLKENSTSSNQKVSEISATLQQLSKTTETEKLNLRSTIDGLNSELSAMKENCEASNSKNVELTARVSELNEHLENKKEELKGRIDSFSAERKELEDKIAKVDHHVKEKEKLISELKAEFDRVSNEVQQKETELRDVKDKFENQITAAQLTYESLMDVKQSQDKQIESLESEKSSLLNKLQDESMSVESLRKQLCEENKLKEELQQKSNDYTEMSKTLESVQQSNQGLEENLRNAEIRTSEIETTYKAQITELETRLKLDQETSSTKIKELESIISNTEKETNKVKESLQKILKEKQDAVERMGVMESEAEKFDSKFKEIETEKQLLKEQKDLALNDRIELEKRLHATEEKKSLLLEKCVASETEFEQLQQKLNGMQRKLDDSYAALQELGRENQSLQMESAKLQGRKWADDSVVTNCSTCGKDFSLTIRKHHCRHCGQIFCGECSSRTAAVPSCKKPARVCDNCYQELLTK